MKTSNILIIFFFTATVVIMTLMQFVVKQKEKKNEFISQKELRKTIEEKEFEVVGKNAFDSIKLDGLKNVFVAYADSFKVLIRKTKSLDIIARSENNCLTILSKKPELYKNFDDYLYNLKKDIIIYCPKFSAISASNSTFIIDTFPKNISIGFDIALKDAVCSLGNLVDNWDLEDFSEKPEFFFKNISLKLTDNGYFKLDPLVKVGNLSIATEGKPKIFVPSALNFDSLKAHLSDSTTFKTTIGVIKAAKFN